MTTEQLFTLRKQLTTSEALLDGMRAMNVADLSLEDRVSFDLKRDAAMRRYVNDRLAYEAALKEANSQ